MCSIFIRLRPRILHPPKKLEAITLFLITALGKANQPCLLCSTQECYTGLLSHDCSPLASVEFPRSTFAGGTDEVFWDDDDDEGRRWLRKTPGAMGCEMPAVLPVPVLSSGSAGLVSKSGVGSGELLSWESLCGSSTVTGFFLVFFFFFLIFCSSCSRNLRVSLIQANHFWTQIDLL